MTQNITREMVTDKDCTECENDTATWVNKDYPDEIFICDDDYSALPDRDKKDYVKISELPFAERNMDAEIFGEEIEAEGDEDNE